MTKYKISKEQAAEVRECRKGVKDKYLDRRLRAIELLGEGMKACDIAEKLDADKRQISEWAKNYCERGLEGFVAPSGVPTASIFCFIDCSTEERITQLCEPGKPFSTALCSK